MIRLTCYIYPVREISLIEKIIIIIITMGWENVCRIDSISFFSISMLGSWYITFEKWYVINFKLKFEHIRYKKCFRGTFSSQDHFVILWCPASLKRGYIRRSIAIISPIFTYILEVFSRHFSPLIQLCNFMVYHEIQSVKIQLPAASIYLIVTYIRVFERTSKMHLRLIYTRCIQ